MSNQVLYIHLPNTQEEKALYVDVDSYCEHDYLIAFADSQKLQRLRRKLVKSKEILDCYLEVALDCEQHWQQLRQRGLSGSGRQQSVDLGAFRSRIKTHRRGVKAILEHAEGIATMVPKQFPNLII